MSNDENLTVNINDLFEIEPSNALLVRLRFL